jgi:hypothetical protein
MKAFVLTAAMLMAAGSSSAAMPAAIDSDPLMKQILAKQIALPNGGVTAAVAVRGAANGIELQIPDPLAPLAPAEGLAERQEAPAKAGKKRARPGRNVRASEQAEALENAGPVASFERAAK